MNNGLLDKLAFWRSATSSGELGLFISTTSLWVFQPATDAKPESFAPFDIDSKNWSVVFDTIKNHYGTAKLQIVLSTAYYQLLQADKPTVDESEISQALIWSVKDMVSEPISNIHLDYFESPIGSNNKVNVVIAARDKLVALAESCIEHGFEISGISIEELALSHLFSDDNMAHMIVTHMPEQELLLTVVKSGDLLMQRRVRGFAQLDKAKKEDLGYGIADNLSLEIQRSMDYFESQLRQAPVSAIDLLVEGDSQALAQLVAVNFNQTVTAIEHQSVPAYLAKLAYSELPRGEA